MFSNVISIHLKRFKSVEDLKRVLEDNQLQGIDPESCYGLMIEGYTKLFIDKNTLKVIGYCHSMNKRLIQISEDFIIYLKDMNSITYKKTQINLSVDGILDKINQKGINSLTPQEKQFLKNNS